MIINSFKHTNGGIEWYCELRGSGPKLVLIPSGEGDSASFEKTAEALSVNFTVLTFDTPGFSRTSTPAKLEDISLYRLGAQIVGLIRSLEFFPATFYGCSSGGIAVFDIIAGNPEVVRNAIVHEAAIVDLSIVGASSSPLLQVLMMSDSDVVLTCKNFFAHEFNEDVKAWNALGPDYHYRLERNYVTWIRQYIAKTDPARQIDPQILGQRPLTWTVGGLSATERTLPNVRLAYRAGIDIQLLPCLHFPQVSIPLKLADHISRSTAAHL